MEVGMFQTPYMAPERTAKQVFEWSVRQAVIADEVGFAEYWVGEHATLNWESIPSPELVVAAAALQTKRIRLGPLAHLLPYYHPSTLAMQAGWLSQILEGRYMLGIAPGAYPGDAALRGFKDLSKNHRMMMESVEIMEQVWKGDPFEFKGEFWEAGMPHDDPTHPMRDMKPHGGHMPIAMTGLSPNSPSIKYAARHGYIPASVYAGNEFLSNHFEIYAQTAGEAGHPASRSMHRVVRDVFVARTDAEARKLATEGAMGRAWMEYLLPTYHTFGVLDGLLHDKTMDKSKVDADYLAEHVWIVGSPDTVAAKLQKWSDDLGGGFGMLLIYSHDYYDNPGPWEESMRLLAQEVMPRIRP